MSDAETPLSPSVTLTPLARGSSVVGRFLRTRAAVAQAYSQSVYTPSAPTMTEVSSLASSPSLYSRRGSHVSSQTHGVVLPTNRGLGVFADSDYESEEEEFAEQSRLSVVSGPRVRKYADIPWDDDELDGNDQASISGGGGGSNGLSRMFQAAKTRANSHTQSKSRQTSPTGSTMTGTSNHADGSTRKAMALLGKGKQLFPSSSGGSLASAKTISSASSEHHLVTPKLKSPFTGPVSPAGSTQSKAPSLGDHGHMVRDVSEETLLPMAKANNPPSRAMYDADADSSGQNKSINPAAFPTNGPAPGFGLISLEQAQENERQKSHSHRRTGTAHKIVNVKSSRPDPTSNKGFSISSPLPSSEAQLPHTHTMPAPSAPTRSMSNASSTSPPIQNRIKPKKSGIMKLFNKDKSSEPAAVPKLPTPPLPSSLKAANHNNLPSKARSSADESRGSELYTIRSNTGNSTYSASIHSNVASPLPMTDKPLPMPQRSPPKKEKKRSKDAVMRNGALLGEELQKPRLELRPVSMNFSNGFASDYLSAFGDATSSGASSPAKSTGPLTPSDSGSFMAAGDAGGDDVTESYKEQLNNARKGWRLQQFELEAQIRELQQQLEDARKPKLGGCDACGCVCGGRMRDASGNGASVMDRARAKTGGPRGVFGSGSLYES